MMRDLVDLVLTWWKRDLIRVRPSEGRLFRLRPGAVLCFSPSPHTPRTSAEVVARKDCEDPRHPHVRYFCRTSEGDGELIVTRTEDSEPTIAWFADSQALELRVEDIEVFQASFVI